MDIITEDDYFFGDYQDNIDYLNSVLNDRLIREQQQRENEIEIETELNFESS